MYDRYSRHLSEEKFFDASIPLFSLYRIDKNENRIKSLIFIVESFANRVSNTVDHGLG